MDFGLVARLGRAFYGLNWFFQFNQLTSLRGLHVLVVPNQEDLSIAFSFLLRSDKNGIEIYASGCTTQPLEAEDVVRWLVLHIASETVKRAKNVPKIQPGMVFHHRLEATHGLLIDVFEHTELSERARLARQTIKVGEQTFSLASILGLDPVTGAPLQEDGSYAAPVH